LSNKIEEENPSNDIETLRIIDSELIAFEKVKVLKISIQI
jgi:hypothetical protein